MKKFIFYLFTFIFISVETIAQTVSVENVEAVRGKTASFSVSLSNGTADTYKTMTLYIQLPAATGYTVTKAAVSDSWSGTSCEIGNVDDNGVVMVAFASSNVIPGTAIDNLVTIYFTTDSSVTLGEHTITLKGTKFEYGTSSKVYAVDASFIVNVVDYVTLDEESTTAPSEESGVKVKVKRTINANEWSTICLPFAMTAEQMATAFGNDVKVKDFAGCDVDDNNNITVNFTSVTAMKANHPYIIKVSNDITTFTVEDVDVAPSEDPSIYLNEETFTYKGKTYYNYNCFMGNYVNGTEIPDKSLFINNNKFYFSKGNTKIKAFRGYFTLDTAGADYGNYSSSRLFMHFDDDEATSINSVKEDANDSVYDLQGRRVDNRQLSKGVYIVNGKKVLMK